MIYLIRSYGFKGKSVLKIGFTDKFERRMEQYFYTNPMLQIVSTREGDEILENLLHRYLYFLGFQYKKEGRLNEWFQNVPEIYQIFHYSRETLEKLIWKNRDKILNPGSKSSADFRLFKYLYLKNRDNFTGNEFNYDGGKLTRSKAKDVDVSFWSKFIKKELEVDNTIDEVVSGFLRMFRRTGIFEDKMKMYCEFMDTHKDNSYILDQIIHKVDPKFKTYYDLYGTSGCRSVSYQEIYLKRRIGDSLLGKSLKSRLSEEFKIGNKLTLRDIKLKLRDIYNSLNISKTPKAKDLEQYFSVKESKLQDSLTKKRSKGYKILGLL